MTDIPGSADSLSLALGARFGVVDGQRTGWIDARPALCRHGVLRAAGLVMLIDMAAGYEAEMHAGRDWNFTADLGVRRSPVPIERVEGIPVVQRAGRTISIDVPLRDADGRAVGHGVSTFTRVAARPGDPERPDYPLDSMAALPVTDLDAAEALEARPDGDDLVVELRPGMLNPAGVLQGGVASLIAEMAALRVAEERVDGPLVVTAFDIRYVSMGRVGPVRAVVELLGRPADGLAVVKLLDTGAEGRVITHNLLGFAPPG